VKEFLSSAGVEFDAKDVTTKPEYVQELMEVSNGRRGVPTLVIGDQVVIGFNKERISELLKLPV